jgi:beta-glucosidase
VYANVALTAGKPVNIEVDYSAREALGEKKHFQFGINFGPYVDLGWSGPNDLMAKATEAARAADVAVVFVGHQVGEGMDRLSLGLPNDQNALIEAVAKANPHTVVVLNTGGAVTMPWLARAGAVLETWLPGDSDGPATAKLLFGDADPGGRLPVTFPADETQGPGTKSEEYPGATTANGTLDTVKFDEGVFVGYRFWDEHAQKPLFPFGYGLSYTTFAVKGRGVKANPDGSAMVSVDVTNTGKRAGSDVVEVYVRFPKGAGEPPAQLKGFDKVALAPGESKTVEITLVPEDFQNWDEGTHKWVVTPGEFGVMVGNSSRDFVWTGSVTPVAK